MKRFLFLFLFGLFLSVGVFGEILDESENVCNIADDDYFDYDYFNCGTPLCRPNCGDQYAVFSSKPWYYDCNIAAGSHEAGGGCSIWGRPPNGDTVCASSCAKFVCCDRVALCTEGETSVGDCNQLGVCFGSYKTCQSGDWSECFILPQGEVCDGLDNDCDGEVDEGISCLFWMNMNFEKINEDDEVNVGDRVLLFASDLSSGVFNVEQNSDGIIDILGTVSNDNLIGEWKILESELGDNGEDIYFTVDNGGIKSGFIDINEDTNDSPMNVTIVSPRCGSHYDENDDVVVNIEALDEDDAIFGKVIIDGDVINFTNGGVEFSHVFDVGNSQIIVEAENTRGERVRIISNIMILDKQGEDYVDRKYVAACITEPANFMNFKESKVSFDASATRAVSVVGGILTEFTPENNPTLFSWYWRFMPDNVARNYVNSEDSLAYRFNAEFPTAGRNSANLRVDFE